MSRIKENSTLKEIVVSMYEGNPGALRVLMELVAVYPSTIQMLDDAQIYGTHIYMLHNDCCGGDIDRTVLVILGINEGRISQQDINERLKNVGRGKPFEDLLRSDS